MKKEPRDEFMFLDQDSCPHKRTSSLKSTKNFVTTFCMDCGLIIDRRPREEVEEARAIAQEVEHASRRVQRTASRIVQDPEVTPPLAHALIQSFVTCAGSLIAGKNGDNVLASELHECLADCIDVVVESSRPHGVVRSREEETTDVALVPQREGKVAWYQAYRLSI